MNFSSDNITGVSPRIMEALVRADDGMAMPYGNDALTARLNDAFADLFGHQVWVFPVTTGSAANGLALASMTPSYGAVYCHETAHINVDECGAPEFFTGGAKLVPLAGEGGKLTPAALAAALARAGKGQVHYVQPAVLSLTQSTECGTVYGADDIRALTTLAHREGLRVHLDGARLANAVTYLEVDPAEITWRAGVDVLCFGASKNGALNAEAVIFFSPEGAEAFGYRRKRGGHLPAKARYLAAQLLAYIEDGLWLDNARHANDMAARLGAGLKEIEGVGLVHPVEANEVFLRLPAGMAADLREAGFAFYDWPHEGPDCVRLVTSFSTDPAHVDALLAAVRRFG